MPPGKLIWLALLLPGCSLFSAGAPTNVPSDGASQAADQGVTGTWTVVASGTSQSLHGVWGNAGHWLAVGASGTALQSSDDGATWASISGALSSSITIHEAVVEVV